jgi:glycosyltransferase involved in cell wall biosynthesis
LRDSIFILLGKITGKKIAVHFHGGNFDLFFAQQKSLFKKYITSVLKMVDRLIVLADKFKLQFKDIVDPARIDTLYNCLPESCQLSGQVKGWPKGDKLRVLFLGYLSKAKGALDVVQAVPLVISKQEKPIEFILCGQPVDIERNITFIPEPNYGYSKILKIIKEENLAEYITIREKLDLGEKEELLANADIFVFPTYSEGCGLVALEAMSYSLPIITTKVGALSEMLEENENCLFVEPGDFGGLAQKLLFLINNSETAVKMGSNNRQLVSSLYNREIYVNSLANIWYNLFSSTK